MIMLIRYHTPAQGFCRFPGKEFVNPQLTRAHAPPTKVLHGPVSPLSIPRERIEASPMPVNQTQPAPNPESSRQQNESAAVHRAYHLIRQLREQSPARLPLVLKAPVAIDHQENERVVRARRAV